MKRYNPKEIEPKWQKVWDETGVYTTDLQSDKPKYIAMSMFNYPSGAGIHIGHAMNYTISDVKARFKRQQGFESYHPVGWDAFGMPAENYAIKSGVSPQESMANIIPGYHKQYKAMGWSNDWEKEIATHLPEYYKWTQWIFTQMHRHGLAYQDSRMQWWCPIDSTVLANEQVIDGKCWRHDGSGEPPAEKREVKQWFFKITEYADELLEATDGLDWTESVKLAQKNWIGKSVGAEVDFEIDGSGEKVTVFTTRADTLYGATFIVLAPEHELVARITTEAQKAAVEAYAKQAERKTEVERQSQKDKTGVFTGAYAINPVSGRKIPVWVADYVLVGYGTGAIMAVPAHDERDHEFAEKFKLPVTWVVDPDFIREDVKDKTEFKQKKKIVAVVENAKGEVLTINWGVKLGGRLTIGGTVEGDETPEATALREIKEETGYTDLEVVAVGQEVIRYKYYAFSKQEAHDAEVRAVHVRLKSEARQSQNLDSSERGNFKVEWVPRSVAETEIIEPLHRYGIEKFLLGRCYHGEGILTNSGPYNGLRTHQAREQIVHDLGTKGTATERVNFRMNDWSVSRQRYWGAPIPIIHCPKCGPVLVPDKDLPVVLPELDDFQPSGDGRSALARAQDWLTVACPECGGPAERETDTLDTYICSSWYMYRYMDPHNQQQAFDPAVARKWEPVDFYNGADHATAHLLYARFIGHFFKKLGLVNEPEPFKQFVFNGKVVNTDGSMFSKSKGVVIDPLDIINQGYGADALRTYLMFAAPLELWTKWDPQGVPGTYRFLNRVWTLVQQYLDAEEMTLTEHDTDFKILHSAHTMIRKVTQDLEHNQYNTAVAAMMACTNDLYKFKEEAFGRNKVWDEALRSLVACVAPFAPYIGEELWHQLGHSQTVHKDSWPELKEEYLQKKTVTVAIQVNGKLRATLDVSPGANEASIVSSARENERVRAHLDGREMVKTIYVPGKLLNFVVR